MPAGLGTALKPAQEPIVLARKPLNGTVAATVIAATRVRHASAADLAASQAKNPGRTDTVTSGVYGASRPQQSVNDEGRWPTNVLLSHAPDCGPDDTTPCVEGCPVAELDRQAGIRTSGANPTRRGSDKFRNAYGDFAGQRECVPARGADSGKASRFYPVFRFQAKAPTRERPKHEGTAHPTVKPLALMRWLVRLVTPPGGTVLEPFAGSGATVEACIAEGFRCVAIEREADYLPLIAHRVERAELAEPQAEPSTEIPGQLEAPMPEQPTGLTWAVDRFNIMGEPTPIPDPDYLPPQLVDSRTRVRLCTVPSHEGSGIHRHGVLWFGASLARSGVGCAV